MEGRELGPKWSPTGRTEVTEREGVGPMLKADELKGEARRPAPARGGRDSASLVRTGPRPRVDIKSSSYEGEAPQRVKTLSGRDLGTAIH